jgi:hypothetical protein
MCGGGGGGLSSIGNALSSAVQGIGGAVDNIIKNPLPVIMTIALTAAVIATAGAAAPAAFALESGFIASGVSAGLGGGAFATAVGVGVQQAVIAAAVSALNGGDMKQIGTAALQAGVTAGITYGVAQNLPGALSSNPLQPDALAKVASGAIGGAAGAAASAAITGQPIDKAALVGGVAGGAGAYIGDALKGTDFAKDLGPAGVKMLTSAGAAGAGAVAGGKNAGYAATMAAISVGLATSLSNFQDTKKEVQEKIESDPDLKEAAKAVNDAASTLKNTPPEVLNQINNISQVQKAASNISDQITKGMEGNAVMAFDNADIQTLKDTGQFDEQVNQLETIAKGGAIESGAFAKPQNGILLPNGTYKYDYSVTLALATSLTDGAKAYVETISSLSPQIQAYVDTVNTFKTNTSILDAATNNQFSALTSNTEKLINGVTDYNKYNTQINNGTLTSTPQQDALNNQIADQNSTVLADSKILNQLDPNSQEYATAIEKYQFDSKKLTNLAAQSAVLNNYFNNDTTEVTGANVADAIIRAGGNVDTANTVSGYYTDNKMTAPSPVLIDPNGNVILASKDTGGNLTDVYSVGTNGSQVPTTDQLQQIAASDNSTAKTFANDASKLLTGQELSQTNVTPNTNLTAPNTDITTSNTGLTALEQQQQQQPNVVNSGLTNLGNQAQSGLTSNLPTNTTQTDTSNMIPTHLADGTVGFLGPNNTFYNADGTVNASTTSAFNAPNPYSQNNFYQTASANTGANSTVDAGAGSQTPLVPNTGSKTLLTPDQLAEYEAPAGSYFDANDNIYGPDGNFIGMTVTAEKPIEAGTNTLDDILTQNAANNAPSNNVTESGLPGNNNNIGGDNTSIVDGSGGLGNSNVVGNNNVGGSGSGSGSGGLNNAPVVSDTGGGGNTVGENVSNVVTPPLSNVSLNIPTVPINFGSNSNTNTTAPITSPLSTVTPTTKTDTQTSKPPTKPPTLEAGLTQGSQIALPFSQYNIPLVGTGATTRANGGSIGSNPAEIAMEMPPVPMGHNPQFFSEGGLSSIQNRYVTGDGDGTSDSIPAMLANGEFVIPADVVSSLGNGNNDSGAKVLDEFLETIRKHKQKHGAKQLPPDSKGALGYLLEAKHKART